MIHPYGKLARVRRLRGPIAWYLADDHLLAADQSMFEVTYRRFFYDDVRAIVIWPNLQLWWRLGVEAAIGGLIGGACWALHAHRAALVIWLVTAAADAVDGSLGHRTSISIETVHSRFVGTLAPRWRDARGLLERIEARLSTGAGPRARTEPTRVRT